MEQIQIKDHLINRFHEVFSPASETCRHETRAFFAPGRVNLIGEHTDYNGGYVFPCALTIGTYLIIREREDDQLLFYSENFSHDGLVKSSLQELTPGTTGSWTDYPKGVIWALKQRKIELSHGFELLVYGNIPNQSGLSSSASLEVGMAFALSVLFKFPMTMKEIAKLCQYSENQFNGVNCGIMDQFAVAQGKKDHAIFLDTATLEYQYVPVHLNHMSLVVTCSNKKRGLGDSKYNERRSECENALKQLQEAGAKIASLCELDENTFETMQHFITDPIERKRARHAVYENIRTKNAVGLLKQDQIAAFGELMNESHRSLRDDYEVTGIELDTLVSSAWKQEGVIGSRMTGAGFGGCTVSIVKNECVDQFIQQVGEEYRKVIGYSADFFAVQIGDGPVEL